MSKTRNLSDLLDANGDVKSTALDNVPASDVVNDTTPQLGGNLDTNGNNIQFSDNSSARFGTGSDLTIFHDGVGGGSYINESGTGNLFIKGANIKFENSDSSKTYAFLTDGGGVELKYDNSTKVATTSTGVDVTGTLTATAFSGDGSGLTGISGGKVGQILSTTYGTSTGITSTSFVDTGMSANITPSATSSKILVMFQCTAHLSRSNQEVGAQFRLIRDSSVAFWTGAGQTYYQGAFGSVSNNQMAVTQIFSYLDSPNSTSSLNYKLQAAVNSGGGHSVTAQAGNTASVMTLMEILA